MPTSARPSVPETSIFGRTVARPPWITVASPWSAGTLFASLLCPEPCIHSTFSSQDRRNVLGSIAHTRGLPFRDIPHRRHTQDLTSFILSQEFLFYYQRDP